MRARRRRCCVAVQFQVELAFESVLDRLDELADRFEQVLAPVRGAGCGCGRTGVTGRSALGEVGVELAGRNGRSAPPMRVSAYVAVLRSCRKPMGGSPHARATTVRAEIEHRAEQHRQAMAGLQFERAEPLRGRTRLTQSTGGGRPAARGAQPDPALPARFRPDRWWPGTVGSISRRSPQVCTTWPFATVTATAGSGEAAGPWRTAPSAALKAEP